MIKSLLEGLNAMHKQGFCHRSVKPENIQVIDVDLKNQPIVQLANFEYATPLQGVDYLTLNVTLGTRLFMSPELIKKETHDAAVDIWAVGITAFYLLTYGEYPFPGTTK